MVKIQARLKEMKFFKFWKADKTCMRTDFRKSFARDLRNRKNDFSFLNRIKKTNEDIELTETISGIKSLKKLKGERCPCGKPV